MTYDAAKSRHFIETINLAGTPRGFMRMDAAADAGPVFNKAKDQAQVVGSGLFSFEQGVDELVREAISDSALLAQLYANKLVKFEQNPLSWFKTYNELLGNVGWTLQEHHWSDYSADGTQVEVNEKILDLLSVALGATPAAAALVLAAMKALQGMNPDSSWITLFSREVQKADMARFQIGLVNTDAKGDVFVSLVACILKAKTEITQVLFFKWKDAHASFQADAQKVSINRPSLIDLGPTIRKKIRVYQADYLSSIKDIDL